MNNIAEVFNSLANLEDRCDTGDAKPDVIKDVLQKAEESLVSDFHQGNICDIQNSHNEGLYVVLEEMDKIIKSPESANFFNIDRIKLDVADLTYNSADIETQQAMIRDIYETRSIPGVLMKNYSDNHNLSNKGLENLREAEHLCERMVMYAETRNTEGASANDRKILADPEIYFDMQHNDFQAQSLIKEFKEDFPEYVQCYLSDSKRERTKLRNEIQEKYVPLQEIVENISKQVINEFDALTYKFDDFKLDESLKILSKRLQEKIQREKEKEIIKQFDDGHKVPNLKEQIESIVMSAGEDAIAGMSFIDQNRLCRKMITKDQNVDRAAALIPDYNPMKSVAAKAQQLSNEAHQKLGNNHTDYIIATASNFCFDIQNNNTKEIYRNYSMLAMSSQTDTSTNMVYLASRGHGNFVNNQFVANDMNQFLARLDRNGKNEPDKAVGAKMFREIITTYMDQNPEIAEKFKDLIDKDLIDLSEKDKAPEHKEDKGLDMDM